MVKTEIRYLTKKEVNELITDLSNQAKGKTIKFSNRVKITDCNIEMYKAGIVCPKMYKLGIRYDIEKKEWYLLENFNHDNKNKSYRR